MPHVAARTASRDRDTGRYQSHRPEQTLLYQIVDEYYPAFAALMAEQGKELPGYPALWRLRRDSIPLRVGRFRKEYPRNSARRRAGAGCRRAPLRGCRARRRASLRRSRNSTPRRSVRGWAGRRCRLAARRLAAGRRVLRFWPVRRFRRSDGRGCLPRGAPRR